MDDSYEDMKERYDEDKRKLTEAFIQDVWNKIIIEADKQKNIPNEDHHISERATKAFLNLYKVKAKPIYITEILQEIKRIDGGFKTYKGVGLWRTLSKTVG